MKGYEKRNCLQCGREYLASIRELTRKGKSENRGKFCSLSCAQKYISSHKEKIVHIPNCVCSYCKKEFYRNKSKKENSKSNLYFCCRLHKDLGQRISFGLKELHPPHYGKGNGRYAYRQMAKDNMEWKCKCGFSYSKLLLVHHKDGDRENNSESNLEVVCPVCHHIRHMRNMNGEWIPYGGLLKLTPREKIKEIEKEVFGKEINFE